MRGLEDAGWVLLDEPKSAIAALFVPLSPGFFGHGGGSFPVAIGLPARFAISVAGTVALGSSVDLLTAANVLRQVPKGGVITAGAMHTY